MNGIDQFEDRASSSRGQHEGEPSGKLCDRLSRTRDASQRQVPRIKIMRFRPRIPSLNQGHGAGTARCEFLLRRENMLLQGKRRVYLPRSSPYSLISIAYDSGLPGVGSLPLLKAYHGDAFVRQRDSERMARPDGEA